VTELIDKKPWYKERWPWLLMAGPALVVVAGIVTVWLAIVSNDGLVADDYYKQGLAVNQRLQRDQVAESLGLQADLMRAGGQIRLMLRATDQLALPGSLKIKIMHPTRAGHDLVVDMVAEGNGFYGGRLAADIGGRWHVSIEDPAGQWRLQGDWQADAEMPLHLVGRTGS
jgi:uncharacterized protein